MPNTSLHDLMSNIKCHSFLLFALYNIVCISCTLFVQDELAVKTCGLLFTNYISNIIIKFLSWLKRAKACRGQHAGDKRLLGFNKTTCLSYQVNPGEFVLCWRVFYDNSFPWCNVFQYFNFTMSEDHGIKMPNMQPERQGPFIC